jgi:DNA polymerase I-like protein with 3'-5' exonuclease and polymerase domains
MKNSQFKTTADSENESWLIFDLESDGLYDNVTKIHCLVIYDIQSGNTFSYGPDAIDNAINHLDSADVLIGHNILFYDIPVIKKLHGTEFNGRVIDTLICTRLIWPKETLYDLDEEQYQEVPPKLKGSASLKAWGYRLADHKIEFQDFTEYSQEMLDYCIQDVRVTEKLWNHIINQKYPESSLVLEHDFAQKINKQIRTGIPFDVDRCLDLVDDLRAKKQKLEHELKTLFPPLKKSEWFTPKVNNQKRGYVKGVPFEKIRYEEFNPGSRKQIIERLYNKYKWVPEGKTEKGNPKLDDDVLDKLPFPEAETLGKYMLINKRLGQIADGNNAWLKLVNNDTGRIHGDVITNGTITGRCSHRNPNCSQVVANGKPYGKECRSLFHSPYDWDLIGIDAKALELRCLAGYLALWDDGEYASMVINPEVDIHTYNQEQFGVANRDISKRLLYGMLYGCGAAKAGTIIDPNEKNESKLKTMGRSAINGFMKGVPALKKLKDQIEETISSRGYLIGLDRRILHCRSSFKGLNVLLQSAGGILMKQVVVNIHNNIENNLKLKHGDNWEQLLMIHDEVQLTCNKKYTEKIREQAMIAFPQAQEFFNFRCKIEGDSCIGSTWAETH